MSTSLCVSLLRSGSNKHGTRHVYQTSIPNDVLGYMTEWCDILVLARLACVCTAFANVVHREKRLRISRAVTPWIGLKNLAKFYHNMEYHGFVISGSLALKLSLAATFECNIMTLVVPKGDDANALIVFITSLGFGRARVQGRPELHRGLYDTRTSFVHSIQSYVRDSDRRSIEIVQSASSYALDAVLSHPSTLMQNFVSAHHYGSFYPWFTFKNLSVLATSATPNRVVSAQLVKYRDRGFATYATNRFLSAPCGETCPLQHHTILDGCICISRHSPALSREETKGMPPEVAREWIWELDDRVHFRLSSQCHNQFCPRRNAE